MEIQEFKKEMPEIFEKVKKDVRRVLKRHRAGLDLYLVKKGMFKGGFIGGWHYYPGHKIFMNISPLKIIIESQPYEIVWAYTYHILLHEYIHSLGEINEYQCRELTLKVTEEVFKEADHPAIILAKNGIGAFFPFIEYGHTETLPEGIFEYVRGFDRESQDYFS